MAMIVPIPDEGFVWVVVHGGKIVLAAITENKDPPIRRFLSVAEHPLVDHLKDGDVPGGDGCYRSEYLMDEIVVFGQWVPVGTVHRLRVEGNDANTVIALDPEPDGGGQVTRGNIGVTTHGRAQQIGARDYALWVVPTDSPAADGWFPFDVPRALDSGDRVGETAAHTDQFVNPYAFVPLPECVKRDTPVGHARQDPARFYGTIDVDFTARSPLLLRDGVTELDRLHGSGFKGAVRAVHEAVAGGCVRVADWEFVPVYRSRAHTGAGGALDLGSWKLASVTAVDDAGFPTFDVYPQVGWVRAGRLSAAKGDAGLVRTGDCFSVIGAWTADRKQDKLNAEGTVEYAPEAGGAEDRCRVLVSDPSARAWDAEWWLAVTRGAPEKCTATSEALAEYEHLVDGSDDLRLKRSGANIDDWMDHTHADGDAGTVTASRRRATDTKPQEGELLWVECTGGSVTSISRSVIWRHTGTGSLSERVPDSAHACQDPGCLCMTCRLFGSADDESARGLPGGKQGSYRGHVRFTDLAVTSAEEPFQVELAPMGAPRMGAGQFYLDNTNSPTVAAGVDARPMREWGANGGNARRVAGRKGYWHGTNGRHIRRDDQPDALVQQVDLLPEGSTLAGRMWFENLSEVELGSLLASLRPDLLAAACGFEPLNDEHPSYGIHLGGGKPLGLGSVECTKLTLVAMRGGHRYRPTGEDSGPDAGPEPDATAPGTFVERFAEAAGSDGSGVDQAWPDLLELLRLGAVPADRIWYPPTPGTRFPNPGDESYEWFTKTSGEQQRAEDRNMVPLKRPSEVSRLLPIDGKVNRR